MEVRVRKGAVEETLALRHNVLRPHQFGEELRFPNDDGPSTVHLVADLGGEVVGAAVVFPEAPPWGSDADGAWRLRGMATADGWRSKGIGAAVLAAAVEHVRAEGGRLLWCNARLPAVPFYERAGFERVGEEWDEPDIGPHVAMKLTLQ